jgi:hypothetical protein
MGIARWQLQLERRWWSVRDGDREVKMKAKEGLLHEGGRCSMCGGRSLPHRLSLFLPGWEAAGREAAGREAAGRERQPAGRQPAGRQPAGRGSCPGGAAGREAAGREARRHVIIAEHIITTVCRHQSSEAGREEGQRCREEGPRLEDK